MNMNRNCKKKNFNTALCALILMPVMLIAVLFSVDIKAAPTAQAVIPVKLSVRDKDGHVLEAYEKEGFTIVLTGEDKDTPMPSGSNGIVYTDSISPGEEEIIISFTEAGDYRYTLKADAKEGLFGASSYSVLVRIAPDGYVQAAAFNEAGDKSEISFEMIGEKGQPDAPSSGDKIKDFTDITEPSVTDNPEKTQERESEPQTEGQAEVRGSEEVTETAAPVKESERRSATEKNINVSGYVSSVKGRKTSQDPPARENSDAPSTGDDSLSLYYFMAAAAGSGLCAAVYKLVLAKRRNNI